MAGGGIAPSSGRKQYPGKLTARVLITCIVAATGGLIFGYDLGVSGGVTSMDSFLKQFFPAVYQKESSIKPSDDQYCKFDSQTLTLFTSSLYLAALVACVFASTITRVCGRRLTMILGGVLFLAGALVNAFANAVWMLYVGRLLLGFGIGCANQSVPIYVSETAPSKYRGALNMMFQLSITIGILAAGVLNYFFAKIKGGGGWRLSLGGAAVPAIIIIVGALFLPDTPNSLVQRGKHEEAKAQLLKLRGVPNVDEEFNDLVAARNIDPSLCLQSASRAFQQLTGMNVITFYAPVLFKTMGFGSSASLMSAVITNLVNALATFVSILTVDKVGRRKLFLQGGCQMLLMQVAVGIAMAVKFGSVWWMSIFIYKLLPETKGVPIEEMHTVWENHPFWRKYVVKDEGIAMGKGKGGQSA
ncbi:sugar carrier protein C [Prunus yedoensis var. nudiflora]|uniref:Sugar carrier protein C n=1 Tax=Prunus yedoensis var. nudiflora TaxID=2094558 RepID=A0A314XVL0_PRUYE|nr:sugar carrier protein C [Prunus yedoensis var. nudiflora]